MTKPHYPAHVALKLHAYPAKWCEECGAPLLPKLLPPDKAYRRTHLEALSQFKRRTTCSKACAMAKARRARWVGKEPEEAPAEAPKPGPKPAPLGGVNLDQAVENLKAMAKTMREGLPSIEKVKPRFPDPAGLHASQLTIGHPYAQPKTNGNGHAKPTPTNRRQKRRRFDKRPLDIQVTDLITRTKGRPFTPGEIAKAFDLTEPEADHLLGELADNHQVKKRVDPLGRPQYESIRP